MKKLAALILTMCILLTTFAFSPIASSAAATVTVNGVQTALDVQGYSSVMGDSYVFSSPLIYNIGQWTSFNRYSIVYSANACVKGTISYTLNSSEYTEDFYLEKGTNKSFSSLIDGYQSYASASKISFIRFESLESATTLFSLSSVTTESYTTDFCTNIYYISNSRFKVGVEVSWGGGISYIEDLQDKNSKITNMLNHCDTGRLVQQSYYITTLSPYQCAYYNSTKWAYNPVQGGDQYNHASKIVDISATANSVYIKTRPLDWAQNGIPTYSYMENTYMLTKDYIKVDNSFIDFSGYTAQTTHQELPAFYVVSGLNNFSYYDGTSPWTNSALTTKSNLGFWADSPSSYFSLNSANTETWCSWTNNSGYGIGLFVPNVDLLLAGRYAYNGSYSPTDGATNYVAPLRTLKIDSFEKLEYSYLIASGNLSDIRDTFSENRNFATNIKLDKFDPNKTYTDIEIDDGTTNEFCDIEFTDSSVMDTYINDVSQTDAEFTSDGAKLAVSQISTQDPFVYIDYTSITNPIQTSKYRYLILSYKATKASSAQSDLAEIFMCAGSIMNATTGKSLQFEIITDGEYHSKILKLSGLDGWSGDLNKLRFDYFDEGVYGDVMHLGAVSFAQTAEGAEAIAAEYEEHLNNKAEISCLGASLKLLGNGSAGIRFLSSVEKNSFYTSYCSQDIYSYSENNTLKFGMLVIPSNLVPSIESEIDFLTEGVYNCTAKKIYNENTDTILFTAVVIGIPESFYTTDIIVRPYIIATESNGTSTTYFGEQYSENMYDVAQAALNNPNESDANKLWLKTEIIDKSNL